MAQRRPTAARLTLASSLALVGLASLVPPVAANGIGDLYIAGMKQVLEVRVDQSRVVNTVDIPPVAESMAMSPDGKQLYVSSGTQNVAHIDIETISAVDPVKLPSAAAGLACPRGSVLVAAMPDVKQLAMVDRQTGETEVSAALPGAVDLVAADRRETNVIAAQKGASWIASLTTDTGTLHTGAVTGKVVALAVDRGKGSAWVATRNPDKVWHVRLPELTVIDDASLPGAPVGVASMAAGAIVAGQHDMWLVAGEKATVWGRASGSIVAIAASDDGDVLIAAESTQMEAFGADGTSERKLALTSTKAPLALAVVPAPSSLGRFGVGTTSGAGATPAPTGKGTGRMPVTSSVDQVGAWIRDAPLPGAIATGLAILGIYWLVALRATRKKERARR